MSAATPTATGVLQQHHILVTGAAHGIGRAVALAAAAQGATLILLDKDVAAMETAYDAMLAVGAPQPAIIPMNLEAAVARDYEQLAATLEQEFGPLHALVHCATHLRQLGPLAELEAPELLRGLHVNLAAPVILTQHLLPLLQRADSASVIFSTDRGQQPRPWWGGYGMAQAALEFMAQSWADELTTTRIRVHALDPGPVQTGLRSKTHPAASPQSQRTAEAVAEAYLRLLVEPDQPCLQQLPPLA